MSATSPKKEARLDLLQVLRGVAALSVLCSHTVIHPHGILQFVNLGGHTFDWGWVGVDIFFCISGFIMAWVHGDDFQSPERARTFAYKRFVRIYPPYIVFLFITVIFGAMAAFSGHAPWRDSSEIWQSAFLLPPSSQMIIGVAWTLIHEVFFYLLFCLGIALGRRIAIVGAAVWLVAIFGYPHPQGGTPSQVCDLAFSPVNLEFLAGMAAAGLVHRYKAAGVSWWLLVISVMLLVTGLDMRWWHNFVGDGLAPSIVEKMELALCCSVLIFALVRIEINHRLPIPRFFVLLGTASYSIYLVHANVIRWISYALAEKFPSVFQHPGLLQFCLILMAVAGVAAGLLYHFSVERPLLRWATARGPFILSSTPVVLRKS